MCRQTRQRDVVVVVAGSQCCHKLAAAKAEAEAEAVPVAVAVTVAEIVAETVPQIVAATGSNSGAA